MRKNKKTALTLNAHPLPHVGLQLRLLPGVGLRLRRLFHLRCLEVRNELAADV